jgi:hypothetical protein
VQKHKAPLAMASRVKAALSTEYDLTLLATYCKCGFFQLLTGLLVAASTDGL